MLLFTQILIYSYIKDIRYEKPTHIFTAHTHTHALTYMDVLTPILTLHMQYGWEREIKMNKKMSGWKTSPHTCVVGLSDTHRV